MINDNADRLLETLYNLIDTFRYDHQSDYKELIEYLHFDIKKEAELLKIDSDRRDI